jgi:signal peptidase I
MIQERKNNKRVLVLVAILIVVIAAAFLAAQGGSVLVDGDSMLPTYEDGDRIVIMNLFYTPKHGDVVVLDLNSADFETTLLKRVIGVAGDEIEFDPFETGEGEIYRNGELLEIVEQDGVLYEDGYTISMRTRDWKDMPRSVKVPDGYIFVLGDNRGNSTDSRNAEVGMVHVRRIEGKAILKI